MLMDYRIKRVGQSDELEHALFGFGKKKSSSSSGSGSGQQGAKKGSTWSNHLYIARQKAGDGWRYFYSQAELQAAKAKGAAKQAVKNVGDTARKGLATVKRAGSKAADIASGKYARDIDQNISRRKEYIDTRNNIANASAERWMDTQKQIDANKAHGDAVAADLRKRTKDLEDIEKVYGKKSEQYRVMNEDASKVADELNNYSKEAKRLETKSKKNVDSVRPWWNEESEQRKKLAAEEKARDNDTAYKVSNAINKGKSAVSKLIGNTKDAAEKAITTASDKAKSLADKGKNAIDALAKWRRDVSASHVTFTSDLPSLSKSGKKYYKDAIKNLTDEEIEQDYLSAKRKNSTSPQENDKFELLTAERNYRVASREADRLGRLTDTKSDAAEAALKKYGQDSPQYKKAFDEMEEAFDQLHEAELELARYEKNR